MSQSINKIHSNNLIQPANDEDLYIYNGSEWVKRDYSLHKVYDTDISSLDISSMNDGDYILNHKVVGNMLLYSENFTKERKTNNGIKNPTKEEKYVWVKNHISINQTYTTKIPFVYQNINLLETMNETKVTGKVEHSLEQLVYKIPMKKVAFSCFVKLPDSISSEKVALSMFSDNYNIGITSIFNLSLETASSVQINDKNFSTTASHLSTYRNMIEDVSAGIEKFEYNDNIFFRIYIMGKFNCTSQFRCKMNILNKNSEFKYESSATKEKYSLYISGFQLEEISDSLLSDYITTKEKPITKRIACGCYTIEDGKISENQDISVHYLDKVQERYDEKTDRVLVSSYSPKLNNLHRSDIGVVSSIISFSNNDIEKNKEIIQRRNTNKDVYGEYLTYDDISKEKQQEMLSDGVLKLGMLEDGKGLESKYPEYSIFYDRKLKEYRINNPRGFATFHYKSNKERNRAIIKSMTFNQGYFETWSSKGKCTFKHGFNTGGNYNFWRINKHRI